MYPSTPALAKGLALTESGNPLEWGRAGRPVASRIPTGRTSTRAPPTRPAAPGGSSRPKPITARGAKLRPVVGFARHEPSPSRRTTYPEPDHSRRTGQACRTRSPGSGTLPGPAHPVTTLSVDLAGPDHAPGPLRWGGEKPTGGRTRACASRWSPDSRRAKRLPVSGNRPGRPAQSGHGRKSRPRPARTLVCPHLPVSGVYRPRGYPTVGAHLQAPHRPRATGAGTRRVLRPEPVLLPRRDM